MSGSFTKGNDTVGLLVFVIVFAILMIVVILALPAPALRALGNWIMQATEIVANAIGNKLQAANNYNAT
jgi:hypothetical protein